MYHYVRPSDPEFPFFKSLHIDDFIQQLDFFDKEFGYVSKADFIESLQTGKPVKGVILTFDDALKDHYSFVLPELQKRGLWGIFYVCTGVYSSKKLLDVHRTHMLLGKFGGKIILDALRTKLDDSMLIDKEKEGFAESTYQYQNNDEYTTEVKRVLNYYISYTAKDELLGSLIQDFFGDEASLVKDFYLTEDEIRHMHTAGMLVGSHTVTHPVLSKLSVADQEGEIANSFGWLDTLLGTNYYKSFCYSFGHLHTFTRDTELLLEQYGSQCAFTVEPREINENDLQNRKQALPRFDCNMFPHGKVRT